MRVMFVASIISSQTELQQNKTQQSTRKNKHERTNEQAKPPTKSTKHLQKQEERRFSFFFT